MSSLDCAVSKAFSKRSANRILRSATARVPEEYRVIQHTLKKKNIFDPIVRLKYQEGSITTHMGDVERQHCDRYGRIFSSTRQSIHLFGHDTSRACLAVQSGFVQDINLAKVVIGLGQPALPFHPKLHESIELHCRRPR
jgi:hypothetical protein